MKHRPEYDKKTIGKNLRRCRIARKLSVEQVKEYLCLGSLQAIYKWEEGKGYPQTDTMLALMELYGIGLRDLLWPTDVKMSIDFLVVLNLNKEDGQGFKIERNQRRIVDQPEDKYANRLPHYERYAELLQ